MSSIQYHLYTLPPYPSPKKGELVRYNVYKRTWEIVPQTTKITIPKKDKKIRKKTTPIIEINRHHSFLRLREKCIREIQSLLKDKKKSIELFYSWHWHVQLIQYVIHDPIIPYDFDIHDQSLINIFEQKKISNEDIIPLLQKIRRYTMEEYNAFHTTITELPKEKYDVIQSIDASTKRIQLQYNDTFLYINQDVYHKLKKMYTGKQLHRDLFCMILRYETLGSTTSQAALPTNVFTWLASNMNIQQECFASPLNAYFPLYNSAFIDTDIHFGSIGSFFEFFPEKGWFEVNPPFHEMYMQKTIEHIEYLLSNSRKTLVFVIIVPKWDDDASPMWQSLIHSSFRKQYFDIPSKRHQYYTGDQFRVQYSKKMWYARHTTSVFILSNRKLNITIDIETEIKKHGYIK